MLDVRLGSKYASRQWCNMNIEFGKMPYKLHFLPSVCILGYKRHLSSGE